MWIGGTLIGIAYLSGATAFMWTLFYSEHST
jgi:hypothetical protein